MPAGERFWIKTGDGYRLTNGEGFLRLEAVKDNIIRFAYSTGERPPRPTPALTGRRAGGELRVTERGIETGALSIAADPQTLGVTIYDRKGNPLNRDLLTAPGRARVEKELLWEKGFYGLGGKYGWLNKLGTRTENWNEDVLAWPTLHNPLLTRYHTAVNFYLGLDQTRVYGIYFDNSFRTCFDFAKTDRNRVSFQAAGGSLDYYFIYGRSVAEVLRGYTFLTGAIPLPPREFLGYQQSRWSYGSGRELTAVAERLRKEGIPCDILYLDIDYMQEYKVFTIDPEKFPGFSTLAAGLQEQGFKLVAIIDPGVKKEEGYRVYEEGRRRGYFLKDAAGRLYVGKVWPEKAVFPDFFRAGVRRWWGDLHRELIENGVTGIWNDMNEPADFSTPGKTLPEEIRHHDDEGGVKTHAEIHNLYGHYEAEAAYEGLKRLRRNRRPFVLTRAAFAGTQRYAAVWTGDNASLWEHLESSIPTLLNLGLSGFSFAGADVGGFAGDCTGELLARWTQLGAFVPLFRNHSARGTARQEPWCFGEEIKENIRKYIRLRYRFITFLYGLLRESSLTGAPAMRPLFYHFQADEKSYAVHDQFLLGGALLVCPVTRPGVTARLVYLPPGLWYDYWTGGKLAGGRHIVRETPLDLLPLFVRAGSFLPQDEVMDYVGRREGRLEMHCYTGKNGIYDLFVDDGSSLAYETGGYSELRFALTETAGRVLVTGAVKQDKYPLPPLSLHLHGLEKITGIVLDGRRLHPAEYKDFSFPVGGAGTRAAGFELAVEK